jgi:AGCS family alanine or glycine:cation symporter
MQHRKALANGKIMGGPMQYLENLVSPWLAKWYAVGCLLLMVVWSGAQSNQLAAVLNSSFLGSYRISTTVSGLLIALFALITLTGGIRRLGSFSAKLIPVMFILYVGSCLWILGANIGGLGAAFYEVISSFLSPQALATGTVVGGVVAALRWGIFKGVQCCEAGIGTQTIPHSMAETDDPETQATLAILSTYTAGLVAFLSGMVAIVTGYWKDPSLSLGVEIMIASFAEYFSVAGVAVVSISTLLFGFGTILGNAYNGEQCYNYLLDNRGHRYYLLGIAVVIFLSAIAEVALVWTLIDLVLAAMAVPHIATLVFAVRKKEQIASTV